ncbi:hypothetical protein CC86DRAFT_181716 [Ophiobolus disseminans]|uniref:Uncharacterized protein n=1 Tax=Ophiobolus disseminans TaxID=1469910 RepID=A0A6A7ABY4_9PLEO|nr:hypothetical protein CC86DRAFT_181716 [Ophiobolus disseminans]
MPALSQAMPTCPFPSFLSLSAGQRVHMCSLASILPVSPAPSRFNPQASFRPTCRHLPAHLTIKRNRLAARQSR